MRRQLAAVLIALIAFAASATFPFRNNCCCKTGCPMKRAAQMRCDSGTSCNLSSPVITVTLADAILARPLHTTAPRSRDISFEAPAENRVSHENPPDTPPPRA